MTETAHLPHGIAIEIRQGACVDIVTTEYALRVPMARGAAQKQEVLIALLRTTMAALKTRTPPAELAELDSFLEHAYDVPVRDGSRAICNDGSSAPAGECSWESTGGYILSVKPVGRSTRVAVIKYFSG